MAEFDIVKPKYHDVYSYISTATLADAAKGRSILIVGAGSGVGKATAVSFAHAGASNIVLTGRRLSNLQDVKSQINASFPQTNILVVTSDSSDAGEVESLFAQIKDAGIILDVLVNSQGVQLNQASIMNSDPDIWWKEFEIMLKGPYLTTRSFLLSVPRPTERPDIPTRAVVNLSSLACNTMLPNASSYCVLKAALNRVTEYTAAEAIGLGIQAIALHPGGIPDTDLTSKSAEWMMPYYTETAELSGQTVVYLSTNDAAYLNGRYIDARWDLEELKSHKERILREDLLKTSMLGSVRTPLDDTMKKVIATL